MYGICSECKKSFRDQNEFIIHPCVSGKKEVKPNEFLKDYVETASMGLQVDYDCWIGMVEWLSPTKVRIFVFDENIEPDEKEVEDTKLTVELLDYPSPERNLGCNRMIGLDFGDGNETRIFNAIPHNLSAILYA